MQRFRFAIVVVALCAGLAGVAGCGGSGDLDLSGTWIGTITQGSVAVPTTIVFADNLESANGTVTSPAVGNIPAANYLLSGDVNSNTFHLAATLSNGCVEVVSGSVTGINSGNTMSFTGTLTCGTTTTPLTGSLTKQ